MNSEIENRRSETDRIANYIKRISTEKRVRENPNKQIKGTLTTL